MSLISKTSSKSKKIGFSRFTKIRKTITQLKKEKPPPPEAMDMDTIPQETCRTCGNEWTINILKNNIKQQILESVRRLRRTDSWLLSMEKGDVKDLENVNKSEANNAFLWAALLGKFDLMTLFESRGADISYANESSNFNALHLCALNGSLEWCKWLYEKGCPFLQTIDGLTPMHYAVYSNSKDVLEFLINTYRNCISDTVINLAVYANAVECVRLLLSASVDVNSYYEGMTPLHIATDLRYIECMKELLDYPSVDINLKTEHRQYTALHLAAENGDAGCIELLLEKHAKIGEVNIRRETALHLACKANQLDCVKILLEHRAPVDEVDLDMRTPLHVAISEKRQSMDIVKMLVHWKAKVNVSDKCGYTPLHLAAIHDLEECATYLILNGANPAAETEAGLRALNVICRRIPGSVPAIWKRFTKCLAYNSEQNLKFDFRELISNSIVGETGFLYALQKEGHREMLQHPLCRAFLHLKWQKIKWYYYFRVLLVLITVSLLSFVVIIDFSKNCHNLLNNSSDTNNDTRKLLDNKEKICQKNYFYSTTLLVEMKQLVRYAWFATIVMTIANIIRKLLCIVAYSSIKDYLSNHLNLIESILILLIFSLCIENPYGLKYSLQKVAGTVAVLLSWIYLTLTIGQLPYFGTYITMFKKVLKELLKLLSVYFCLLFGFTITFGVIFPTEPQFTNPVVVFVHTLAMMTGELNLNELTDDDEFISNYHKVAVYFVLISFIILVTMALMNLLIGIAVSDVEGLQKTADISKLVHQTQLMYYLELSFFHGYIPKNLTNGMEKHVFVCPSFQNRVIYVKPMNSQEKRFPRDVMVEGMKMAIEKHKRNDGEEKGDDRIEALERKISQMYDLLLKFTSTTQAEDYRE